jgi:hypothetical protein
MATPVSNQFHRTNQGFACVSCGELSPSPDVATVECRRLPTKLAAGHLMQLVGHAIASDALPQGHAPS